MSIIHTKRMIFYVVQPESTDSLNHFQVIELHQEVTVEGNERR